MSDSRWNVTVVPAVVDATANGAMIEPKANEPRGALAFPISAVEAEVKESGIVTTIKPPMGMRLMVVNWTCADTVTPG